MKTLALPVIAAGFALFAAQAQAMTAPSIGHTANPAIVHVAHAGAPYKNVDHKNDAGNDTGDAQVDKLNADSLAKARAGK